MSERPTDKHSADIADKLKQALATLREAFDYAVDTDSSLWDFAVPIREFLRLGLNESDFRWLVRKGYVEHAREVTVPGDDGREFRPTGNLTFTRRTCFVATETGILMARVACETMATTKIPDESARAWEGNGHCAHRVAVHWDSEARALHVNGEMVKRFKWQAANQETVLNAFQEEGWPDRIDDPLPPQPEQDPKRRLSDTIKCLNRKQTKHLIHFRGDGTGEGVFWELVKRDANANGAE
jgi:hypothetical protein